MIQRVSVSAESELKWPGQWFIYLVLWLVRGQVIWMFIWKFDWCDWWLSFVFHRELWQLLFSMSSRFLSQSVRSWISLRKALPWLKSAETMNWAQASGQSSNKSMSSQHPRNHQMSLFDWSWLIFTWRGSIIQVYLHRSLVYMRLSLIGLKSILIEIWKLNVNFIENVAWV